ncbi:MAG: Wzz/FepE/Etk N-terminal domain-containing protein, partial [Gemmatimonadota bacterium]
MTHSSSSPAREPSLADLLAGGWEHRRVILGVPIALALLTLGVTLLQPRTFTSTAAIVPQASTTDLSRVTGLAAQLGLSVPGADQAASPHFY